MAPSHEVDLHPPTKEVMSAKAGRNGSFYRTNDALQAAPQEQGQMRGWKRFVADELPHGVFVSHVSRC